MPESDQHYRIVLRTCHDNRQILLLSVVAVKHRQLLTSVSRIIERVDVYRQVRRRLRERLDERVDQIVPQPPQVLDRDAVFESR